MLLLATNRCGQVEGEGEKLRGRKETFPDPHKEALRILSMGQLLGGVIPFFCIGRRHDVAPMVQQVRFDAISDLHHVASFSRVGVGTDSVSLLLR